uniref:Uncharacterized protein n=1 Tax=Manihot esculenta TaxID=3983 RepID=A0A2C9WJF9_MANES
MLNFVYLLNYTLHFKIYPFDSQVIDLSHLHSTK